MRKLACILAMTVLAACQAGRPLPATQPSTIRTQAPTPDRTYSLTQLAPGELPGPMDATQVGTTVHVGMDVFHLQVPYGTLCRNEEFWKRVDEEALDPMTYDLLRRNGVRVGVAPIDEWPYLSQIIQQHPAKFHKMLLPINEAAVTEVEMKKDLPAQNLFYFDPMGNLVGRSFERSENFIAMTVERAPRRPGSLRVTLCPVVKSMRREFEYSLTNAEREFTIVRPERLYDINLCTELPPNQILIVAPSEESRWPTSIGSSFLVKDGTTEQFEQILILVPRSIVQKEIKQQARR
jgi:hypothetical protein